MFSFFKKKKQTTFKDRVIQFWDSFIEIEENLRTTIDERNFDKSIKIINDIFKKNGLEIAFLMGKGSDKYEFFFSPEGDRDTQFLVRCIIDLSPNLPHWDFYSSKQACSNESLSTSAIEFSKGKTITPEELFFTYTFNEDKNKFDIIAYHKFFKEIPNDEAIYILFILLDTALGEYGTELFIGTLDISKEELPNSINLISFKNQIDKYKYETNFDPKMTPDQVYGVYKLKTEELYTYETREDIYLVVTCNINLQNYYQKPNIFKEKGAHYIFIQIDLNNFEEDNYLNQREEISNLIEIELGSNNDGFIIGYSTGNLNCYIDILIFDNENSIEKIKNIMAKKYPTIHGSIHYFEIEKKGISFNF